MAWNAQAARRSRMLAAMKPRGAMVFSIPGSARPRRQCVRNGRPGRDAERRIRGESGPLHCISAGATIPGKSQVSGGRILEIRDGILLETTLSVLWRFAVSPEWVAWWSRVREARSKMSGIVPGVYGDSGTADDLRRATGSIDGIRQQHPPEPLPLHVEPSGQATKACHRNLTGDNASPTQSVMPRQGRWPTTMRRTPEYWMSRHPRTRRAETPVPPRRCAGLPRKSATGAPLDGRIRRKRIRRRDLRTRRDRRLQRLRGRAPRGRTG